MEDRIKELEKENEVLRSITESVGAFEKDMHDKSLQVAREIRRRDRKAAANIILNMGFGNRNNVSFCEIFELKENGGCEKHKYCTDCIDAYLKSVYLEETGGQQDKEKKEFGWLSPTGVFTESPFGTHEESAEQICEEKGFTEEYWNWVKENRGNEINHLMRDFLSEVKGYCLIHNPSGYTGYIVTNMKNLTKQQKEFLYGYFMDMGDRFKAEQFVDFD